MYELIFDYLKSLIKMLKIEQDEQKQDEFNLFIRRIYYILRRPTPSFVRKKKKSEDRNSDKDKKKSRIRYKTDLSILR